MINSLNVSNIMRIKNNLNMESNSSRIFHDAVDANLFECDDSLLKEIEQYVNNNTIKSLNLYDKIYFLIDDNRFGQVIKLIRKYESLLNIHTIYIMLKHNVLKEYMLKYTKIKILDKLINEEHKKKDFHIGFNIYNNIWYQNAYLQILCPKHINMFDDNTRKTVISSVIYNNYKNFYNHKQGIKKYETFKNNLRNSMFNDDSVKMRDDNVNKMYNTIVDMIDPQKFDEMYFGYTNNLHINKYMYTHYKN